jgi:hypothetical protein
LSTPVKSARRRATRIQRRSAKTFTSTEGVSWRMLAVCVGVPLLIAALWWFTSHYTTSLQNPVQLELRWPVVISKRSNSDGAQSARSDQQGRPLTAWQQYACQQFGDDCRVALAIQRAENPAGKCEIYHYNTDGTLDWGYFQINTVHLKRPGLNLRDLLDCKANIDFAYKLFQESQGFTPWSTYNSGRYRQYLSPR